MTGKKQTTIVCTCECWGCQKGEHCGASAIHSCPVVVYNSHSGAGGGDDEGYMHPDVLAEQTLEFQAEYATRKEKERIDGSEEVDKQEQEREAGEEGQGTRSHPSLGFEVGARRGDSRSSSVVVPPSSTSNSEVRIDDRGLEARAASPADRDGARSSEVRPSDTSRTDPSGEPFDHERDLLVWQGETGNWLAAHPWLDVITQGHTRAEAVRAFIDAFALLVLHSISRSGALSMRLAPPDVITGWRRKSEAAKHIEAGQRSNEVPPGVEADGICPTLTVDGVTYSPGDVRLMRDGSRTHIEELTTLRKRVAAQREQLARLNKDHDDYQRWYFDKLRDLTKLRSQLAEQRTDNSFPDGKTAAEAHCATCVRCQAYRAMADDESRRHAEESAKHKRWYEEERLEAKYAHHLVHGANGRLGNLNARLTLAKLVIDTARIFAVGHRDDCATCVNASEDCGRRSLEKAISKHDESEAFETKQDPIREERGRISLQAYAKKHGKEDHDHRSRDRTMIATWLRSPAAALGAIDGGCEATKASAVCEAMAKGLEGCR